MKPRSEPLTAPVEAGPILVTGVTGVAGVAGVAASPQFHAAFEEEYRLHHPRRGLWFRYLGVALLSSLLTFALTWGFASSRPVTLRLATASDLAAASGTSVATGIEAKGSVSSFVGAPITTGKKVTITAANSGQVALTEAQLRSTVSSLGTGAVFWAGRMANAKYTLNHMGTGQDFIRYLPNGQGLNDSSDKYRVIATYQDADAYETVVAASKITPGVTKTNPDGSFVYYANSTPTHVYLVFKGVPYQIEIFDPVPGESFKLATTPGAVSAILAG